MLRSEWKQLYFPREVICLSVEPLLVFPQFYLNESAYSTDTEDSMWWTHFIGEDEDECCLKGDPEDDDDWVSDRDHMVK